MKNLLFIISSQFVFPWYHHVVIKQLILKSSNQSDSEQAVKKESGKKSPVGTYSAVENGKPMQFILKEDGTGFENYQGTENRPFTWKTKDGESSSNMMAKLRNGNYLLTLPKVKLLTDLSYIRKNSRIY